MSITLVAFNHSSYSDYWASCIKNIASEDEIILTHINLEDLWEVNSNFNWDSQLKIITDEYLTRTLILLAYGSGAFLLKCWLKENQVFISKFKAHAILIDAPPESSWQNNNPIEELIKMDRATYRDKVFKTLKAQDAPKDWIQSIPSKTNFLKSLLLEVHSKTQLLDDEKTLIPLLEEWHEITTSSLPISSANLLKQQRSSLPNWQSFELSMPTMPLFPTSNLIPNIQRVIANILTRSK